MTHAKFLTLFESTTYGDGCVAAERGDLLPSNPHHPGTDNYDAWALGWKAGDDYMRSNQFDDEDELG